MCDIDSTTTTPSKTSSPSKPLVLPSWSQVFSGPCGKFLILCFLSSLAFFIAMIAYVGIYTNSLSNDPNLMCTPFFLFAWTLMIPPILAAWFVVTVSSVWFDIREKFEHTRCPGGAFIFTSLIHFVFFISALLIASILSESGVIIKANNNTDMMFQFLGSQFDPKVYTLFSHSNVTNDTFSNSACESFPFSRICPTLGRFRYTYLQNVSRCQPNAEEDALRFSLLYLEPLVGSSRTALNFGILFACFFTFGYIVAMTRRLSPPNEWIDYQCCLPSNIGPNERTGLI
jgi:hypothetical protein